MIGFAAIACAVGEVKPVAKPPISFTVLASFKINFPRGNFGLASEPGHVAVQDVYLLLLYWVLCLLNVMPHRSRKKPDS